MTQIIRYILIACLCISSNVACKNVNASKLLTHVIKDTNNGTLSREKEKHYAQQLRYLIVQKLQGDSNLDWSLLDEIQAVLLENIRCQFSSISDEEYTQHECVGAALFFKKYPHDLTVNTLIREALLLYFTPHILLNTLYLMDGDNEHDQRILQFFKKMALEGFAPSQYLYGCYLLYGIGIEKDVKEGLKYLDLAAHAGLAKASLALATYYKEEKDFNNCEKYLQLAISYDSIEALTSLTLLELQKGNYIRTLAQCELLLEDNPECISPKIFLGLMYINGWQVIQDTTKGFLLLKESVEKMDEQYDKEIKAITYSNLAQCYENGIGTEKSLQKAEEYFKKLHDLGFSCN